MTIKPDSYENRISIFKRAIKCLFPVENESLSEEEITFWNALNGLNLIIKSYKAIYKYLEKTVEEINSSKINYF